MKDQRLSAQPRPDTGSRPARRLRAQGQVPATLYGRGVEPLSLSVDARELRLALAGESGSNVLFSISLDGADHLALARQIQRHPIRATVDHVDFITVERDREVDAEVPIRLVGEALKVTRADGLVEQGLFRLTVRARPGDIPTHLDVDVTDLTVGESIRVSDLSLPPGVTTEVEGEEPVVTGAATDLSYADDEGEADEAATAEAARGEAGDGSPEG